MATTELTEAATSKFVDTEMCKVHYNEAGTGDPLVMIHGGGPGATGWSNYVRNIGFLSDHYRVILPDMPNYGKSDAVTVTDEPRAKHNAKTLKATLDALNIDKVNIVGNSMGGATALNFALDYPDRLGKMVLMGAAFGGLSLFTNQPTEGIKLLMAAFANPTVESLRRFIDVMVFDSSFITDELLEQRVEALLSKPEHAKSRRESTNVLQDLSTMVQNVPHETLILHGRNDRVVPLEGSLRLLSGMPNARMVIFSQCGHWVQTEKFEVFNRYVLDFMQNG